MFCENVLKHVFEDFERIVSGFCVSFRFLEGFCFFVSSCFEIVLMCFFVAVFLNVF